MLYAKQTHREIEFSTKDGEVGDTLQITREEEGRYCSPISYMARQLRNVISNYCKANDLQIEDLAYILATDVDYIRDYLDKKVEFNQQYIYRLVRLGIDPIEFSRTPGTSTMHTKVAQCVISLLSPRKKVNGVKIPSLFYEMIMNNDDRLYDRDVFVEQALKCGELPIPTLEAVAQVWRVQAKDARIKNEQSSDGISLVSTAKGIILSRETYKSSDNVTNFDDTCPSAIEDELRDEIAALKNQLQAMQSKCDAAEKKIQELTAENAELSKQNKDIYKKYTEGSQRVHQLEQKLYAQQDSILKVTELEALVSRQKQTIDTLLEKRVTKVDEDATCEELYEGELDYFLTEAIEFYLCNIEGRTRRSDLLREYLSKVVKTDVDDTREQLRVGTQKMKEWIDSKHVTNIPMNFGKIMLLPISKNEHVKFAVCGNTRYQYTISATPSEYRSAQNHVSEFNKLYL